MKLTTHRLGLPGRALARARYAFTLPEMMVAMTIFGMALTATLSSHLFGLRQDQLLRAKLGTSDEARTAFNLLVREIQTAKLVRVGNGSLEGFTPVADGKAQQGLVLQIHPTTNQNAFIRYAVDTERGELWRLDSRGQQGARRVAEQLSGATQFRLENHLGTQLTNLTHNPLVAFHIEFQQPHTQAGAGFRHNAYQMTLRAARRASD